jgi:hypothetical protein
MFDYLLKFETLSLGGVSFNSKEVTHDSGIGKRDYTESKEQYPEHIVQRGLYCSRDV